MRVFQAMFGERGCKWPFFSLASQCGLGAPAGSGGLGKKKTTDLVFDVLNFFKRSFYIFFMYFLKLYQIWNTLLSVFIKNKQKTKFYFFWEEMEVRSILCGCVRIPTSYMYCHHLPRKSTNIDNDTLFSHTIRHMKTHTHRPVGHLQVVPTEILN